MSMSLCSGVAPPNGGQVALSDTRTVEIETLYK